MEVDIEPQQRLTFHDKSLDVLSRALHKQLAPQKAESSVRRVFWDRKERRGMYYIIGIKARRHSLCHPQARFLPSFKFHVALTSDRMDL
jgi:hypothetical protein